MKLPFSKNKSDENKKEKKSKKTKPDKNNGKLAKNKNSKKAQNKETKTVNPEVTNEGKKDAVENKKKYKIAMIVTIAVILVIIAVVVLFIFVFPKKNKQPDDSSISDSSVSESIENSDDSSENAKDKEQEKDKEKDKDKEKNKDKNKDKDKKDTEEESSQLVDENGVPLVPDPEFGLMSVNDAMEIVKTQFDTGEYEVELYDEKLVVENNTYSAFTISDDGKMIGSPIVVNRKTGEYMCYYPEQMFSDIIDFPLVPADAQNYTWNGSFARKDESGNVTSMLTVKQLKENEMHFVISTYVKDESETVSGIAKVRDNVAVYTDGDFFRIEFVMFDSGVTVTESGKNKHQINATFDGKYGVK